MKLLSWLSVMSMTVSLVLTGCATSPVPVPVEEAQPDQPEAAASESETQPKKPPEPSEEKDVVIEEKPQAQPSAAELNELTTAANQSNAEEDGEEKPNPILVALLDTAEKQQDAGQLTEAATSLERALRIQPNNASLYQRLAKVRVEQGEFAQAEQLARKGLLLAAADKSLQRKLWKTIMKSRLGQRDFRGARAAQQEYERLE